VTFHENFTVYGIVWCGKICYSQTGHIWQYGACAVHAAYPRLQTHTQNM